MTIPAAKGATQPQPDREQLATVLDQIAGHSSDSDIRLHIRQVAAALRGNGLIIVNGPPQRDALAEHG